MCRQKKKKKNGVCEAKPWVVIVIHVTPWNRYEKVLLWKYDEPKNLT